MRAMVESHRESDRPLGHAPTYSRYRDPVTQALGRLASEWESQHRAYQAAGHRALHIPEGPDRELVEDVARGSKDHRDQIGKRMSRLLRSHPLYDWMGQHKGFPRAVHTARLIAGIGDPMRFPGRVCSVGHHLPEDWPTEVCPVLLPCKDDEEPQVCGQPVGERRRGTGVRALWHYLGLFPVDGKLARLRKGQVCTWAPKLRTALLMPDVGIVCQIVRKSIQPWEGIYRKEKDRLTRERGAERRCESEVADGPSPRNVRHGRVAKPVESEGGSGSHGRDTELQGGAESPVESEERPGPALRPIQIDKTAKIIAVKAMVGDLLMAWKKVVA